MVTIDFGGPSKILIKNKLEEISLDQYLAFMEARQRETEVIRDGEFHAMDVLDSFDSQDIFSVPVPEEEEEREEYYRLYDQATGLLADRLEAMLDQLKALAASSISRGLLDDLPEALIAPYVSMLEIELSEEFDASTTVVVPGVNDAQIQDMKDEISEMNPEFESQRIYEYNKRIQALSKHTLTLKPVKDAIFAAYMRASSIEQAIPQQDADLFNQLEEQDIDVSTYERTRADQISSAMTVKERKELRERDQLVRRFLSTSATNFIKRIPELVSLFLVPDTEPFSMYYSRKRQEKISEMNMHQLLCIINFIEAVLLNSSNNTATSSLDRMMTASRTPLSQLRRESTILESMAGSRLLGMFS